MPKGRKRKAGKRTASGQLSRAGERVKPSDWVAARQERFGNHYSSALGRAYISGLFGKGPEAKERYDAGNKFALRYSKLIGGDSYSCPLGDGSGGTGVTDHERDLHQQEWLDAARKRLDDTGGRPYLDQLILKTYTDTGPYWLDAILDGEGTAAHKLLLKAAIKSLDTVGQIKDAEPVDIPLHMCNRAVNA
ncbi:hypothetical protein HME9302_00966 [Alteripontixanthobacter maritimus]|uniref:Uncharacterized protein n=1 Tax=Alteripontixanthobacter maritimus TaxID=2161824 RepID=A0A369Q4F2_9SPHN|nr:hypothetical protein [Alteripontixanthobacter maritimus]RDC59771.1 hypothetical protein HME9302_00966 [Alteripontixanthobacter maritimus]